ncbi:MULTISPECIES: hypothetical protein [unclassified Oleiphilus]|jgi:hypothetical protein|uniref:hypothetical protein n=2 Tax=Oleiphilus TaxID=141450 RepID=UPI0007C2A71E|nr:MULTISPECIES: hypothetical protein [unclassified Oleiphilus]KZY42826.1 hypothetical protein A3732_15590 [Oleiphilus sp. HI0050]KZY76953.1 hypothetical protein A3740_11470 [Oleiphilus sp. HI0068]KZY78751.1 hypothetical protein A3741_21220 [Oleiphilus sp. HI0069]KZY85925.1 hypothetical protein A3743_18140 [Oleiphilus sp. HI0072]KZZ21794.1 hypothetical protein A3749_17245 [Oleiphilus sp. HI0078]KZZ22475.1 hypothetical protein A3752_06320 [Oleiphilus sp. HI0081]
MDYADGLKNVLIQKINKTEKSLYSLKLDYCRFVYGLSHRSKVMYDQVVYQVRSVDLDSMTRSDGGEWSRPVISAVRIEDNRPVNNEAVDLGRNWELFAG